ncbi:hypothetical protein [Bradyrhizobium sp. SZCCHNRI3042]|uniref:hypothetical protein n=1 Tax=Bradyrhizobium sp. SZCCHNRI3042 TaxID=3057291 RepID=UPI002916DB71|nr:hypothetical protein [Bradyrhizobium sp. SZCCHNRI3042]
MFDIVNSRDFYQKLLEDFDDYMEQPESARHAMNCAITAHHMADWTWVDFVKGDVALKANLKIKNKDGFMKWIELHSPWYAVIQSISNGSKHFLRENAKGTQKIEGWGMGGWGQGPFGRSYLALETSPTDPKNTPVSHLLEVVIRFWRDFLKTHGPYETLPRGKTKLFDE